MRKRPSTTLSASETQAGDVSRPGKEAISACLSDHLPPPVQNCIMCEMESPWHQSDGRVEAGTTLKKEERGKRKEVHLPIIIIKFQKTRSAMIQSASSCHL
jgi:hypothetical protein